jgi:hypothetical protein
MSMILPPNWVQIKDPKTDCNYYANLTTNETRWDPPPALAETPYAVPPPPPPQHQHQPQNQHQPQPQWNTIQNNVESENNMLIPMARSLIINSVAAYPDATVKIGGLELEDITTGQIADLCHLQQMANNSTRIAYEPLNPYMMPVQSARLEVEPARIDSRIASLREELSMFGG